LLEDGVLEIGAIHTYVELYARLLVDLAYSLRAFAQALTPVQLAKQQ
jgi:hypothetical protein